MAGSVEWWVGVEVICLGRGEDGEYGCGYGCD